MSSYYQWDGDTLCLTLRIQPRASRDEIVGPYGDALKIRITAPPVEGKANSHLIAFLAKTFGVAKADVTLLTGETGRAKRLRIRAPKRLPACIPAP